MVDIVVKMPKLIFNDHIHCKWNHQCPGSHLADCFLLIWHDEFYSVHVLTIIHHNSIVFQQEVDVSVKSWFSSFSQQNQKASTFFNVLLQCIKLYKKKQTVTVKWTKKKIHGRGVDVFYVHHIFMGIHQNVHSYSWHSWDDYQLSKARQQFCDKGFIIVFLSHATYFVSNGNNINSHAHAWPVVSPTISCALLQITSKTDKLPLKAEPVVCDMLSTIIFTWNPGDQHFWRTSLVHSW